MKTKPLPVPVISIGNLTLGGTGKTPMTQFVVRHLVARGRKPVVISRGYGGEAACQPRVVSDGKSMLMSPAEAGDEPCLLAESLPGVPVVVGSKRYEAGMFALRQYSVDVVVLDDAFQHLGVARDLDVVLFSTESLLGNGRVFPGGPLREPPAALKRADVFVFTGLSGKIDDPTASVIEMLKERFPDTPTFFGRYRPETARAVGKTSSSGGSEKAFPKFFGFAGIANPESFRKTLVGEGYALCGFRGFPDHHQYSAADVAALAAEAGSAGAEALVTTRKDLVKIKEFAPGIPVFVVSVDLVIAEGFTDLIDARLADLF